MTAREVDRSKLVGFRGELVRPQNFEGERFTHGTIAREDASKWAGGSAWWIQLREAKFYAIDPEGWKVRYGTEEVPQDGPRFNASIRLVDLEWVAAGPSTPATEWRSEAGMWVTEEALTWRGQVFKTLPMLEGPDEGLITALADAERARARREGDGR